ncbi:hypothetical protein [Caulobacter phage Cr30]|uniref:hypothetical protein n=1 Tax=Caulobacter phage Cr30 TaxID=1357714 RepID=UPI0004A9B4AE|nr:hypothetical protein OZ74_gp139 [Caulobacter phage Cr30]AGS81024.1 hypothetical protein [Caulobacter phage Cr30]
MKRLSDIAYSCYADTLTPPNKSLLVGENGVYIDVYQVLEAKRNRIRKFFLNNFQETSIDTSTKSKSKRKRKKKSK